MTLHGTSARHGALVDVENLDTTVLAVSQFITAGHGRTLFAIADCGDLRFFDALQRQGATHRLRTALTQSDVVFTRTALVGVALESHVNGRIVGQEAAMRRHYVDELRTDVAVVKIEIDNAL